MQFLYYRSRRPLARPRNRLFPILPAPAPQTFGGAPTKFLYYVNRRLRLRLPRRVLPVSVAPAIPWRRSLLRFISRRPQKFFYRYGRKKVIFPPVQPAGFIPRPNRLLRVRRLLFKRLFRARHIIYPPPAPAAHQTEWIIKARRRGRR